MSSECDFSDFLYTLSASFEARCLLLNSSEAVVRATAKTMIMYPAQGNKRERVFAKGERMERDFHCGMHCMCKL